MVIGDGGVLLKLAVRSADSRRPLAARLSEVLIKKSRAGDNGRFRRVATPRGEIRRLLRLALVQCGWAE